MMDFFKKEVASPPFSVSSIVSFLRLLLLPVQTLKSCVQLMACQLVRERGEREGGREGGMRKREGGSEEWKEGGMGGGERE